MARADPPPQWIVVAAEPITDVDTTAADILFDLDEVLDEPRPDAWSSPSSRTRCGARSSGTGSTRAIEPRHFFPTVEAAVDAWSRQQTGARWAAPATDAPPGAAVPEPRPS